MPICTVRQVEVFNTETFDDTLNPVNYQTSKNTEDDLNYIRSALSRVNQSLGTGTHWYDAQVIQNQLGLGVTRIPYYSSMAFSGLSGAGLSIGLGNSLNFPGDFMAVLNPTETLYLERATWVLAEQSGTNPNSYNLTGEQLILGISVYEVTSTDIASPNTASQTFTTYGPVWNYKPTTPLPLIVNTNSVQTMYLIVANAQNPTSNTGAKSVSANATVTLDLAIQ